MNKIGVVSLFITKSSLLQVQSKILKDFVIVNGGFYHRGEAGILARDVSLTEPKDKMYRVHDLSCGENDISLYRRLQRHGLLLA